MVSLWWFYDNGISCAFHYICFISKSFGFWCKVVSFSFVSISAAKKMSLSSLSSIIFLHLHTSRYRFCSVTEYVCNFSRKRSTSCISFIRQSYLYCYYQYYENSRYIYHLTLAAFQFSVFISLVITSLSSPSLAFRHQIRFPYFLFLSRSIYIFIYHKHRCVCIIIWQVVLSFCVGQVGHVAWTTSGDNW